MRRLLLHPLALLALLHLYVGWRLSGAFEARPAVQAAIGAYLLASFALIPLSMNARRHAGRLAHVLAWCGFLCMGLFSSLFVLTLLRDVAVLPIGRYAGAEWTTLLGSSALFVLGAACAASFAGFLIARRGVRVHTIDIPIAALPADLCGFRIAQISDIHVGGTIGAEFVAAIVARVNALDPDVIAITGDVVDGEVEHLRDDTEPLRGLRAREGVFLVTGNHEYYSGEAQWTREFTRLGITVLKNRHVALRRGGSTLLLAGVTDTSAHHFDPRQRSDPAAALRGAPAVAVRVLLAHRPASADDAQAAGYQLQLSGHTHGGQFWPWNLFVGYFNPFSAGLARHHDMWVYVNRGTGYWGPPMRLGIPPEITLLRLTAADENVSRG